MIPTPANKDKPPCSIRYTALQDESLHLFLPINLAIILQMPMVIRDRHYFIGPENAMDICALKLLGDKSSVSLSTLESKGLGNWHLVYNLFIAL